MSPAWSRRGRRRHDFGARPSGVPARIVSMPMDQRLADRGLVLPAPMLSPAGLELPFPWVRLWPGHLPGRAFVSGHGPLLPDGSVPEGQIGKVGADISVTDAYEGARLTALAMLSSLHSALGDLDRVTGWRRVFGMVNVAPGFTRTPAVLTGFSDLILDLSGPEAGGHRA